MRRIEVGQFHGFGLELRVEGVLLDPDIGLKPYGFIIDGKGVIRQYRDLSPDSEWYAGCGSDRILGALHERADFLDEDTVLLELRPGLYLARECRVNDEVKRWIDPRPILSVEEVK